jgi:hypothetical protein
MERAIMSTAVQHATDIVEKVKQRLASAQAQGIHLQVSGHKLDDDWLYIVVVPSQPGVRALEYAEYMSKIERELRKEGDDKVLLVPALDD